MANTEILKTLQLVREAKETVNQMMKSAPAGQIGILERLNNCLEFIEGNLVATALDEKIAKLQAYRKQLNDVNSEIQQDMKDLEAVSKKVGLAAQALGILIDIIGKSTTLLSL